MFLTPCLPSEDLGWGEGSSLNFLLRGAFLMGGLFSQGASEILHLRKNNWSKTRLGKRGVREKGESLKGGNREVDESRGGGGRRGWLCCQGCHTTFGRQTVHVYYRQKLSACIYVFQGPKKRFHMCVCPKWKNKQKLHWCISYLLHLVWCEFCEGQILRTIKRLENECRQMFYISHVDAFLHF